MREQFEKLPEIARLISSSDVWWSVRKGRYFGSDAEIENYVQGAWYAFQEQQKKIDVLSNYDGFTINDVKELF